MTQIPLPRHTRIPGMVDSRITPTVNNPLGVTGCELWWAADTLVLGDGDPIASIVDQSPEHNDGSSVNQPVYKVNIINSKPIMRFAYGGSKYMWHSVSYNEANATWFLLWSRENAADNDFVLGVDGSNYGYLQYGSEWYAYASANQTVAMAAGSFKLKCCTYDGANYRRYTNGVAEIAQAGAGSFKSRGLGSGTFQFGGDVAELVYYDNVLSAGDRVKIETYFNLKYALW